MTVASDSSLSVKSLTLNSTSHSLLRPLLFTVVCHLCPRPPKLFSRKESPVNFCICLDDSKLLTASHFCKKSGYHDHSYTFDSKHLLTFWYLPSCTRFVLNHSKPTCIKSYYLKTVLQLYQYFSISNLKRS